MDGQLPSSILRDEGKTQMKQRKLSRTLILIVVHLLYLKPILLDPLCSGLVIESEGLWGERVLGLRFGEFS